MPCPSPLHVLCLLLLGLLIGCESGQKASTGLNQAVMDFEHERYEQSRDGAVAAMRSSRGPDRERAAYVAGLSAFELGMVDEAERRFLTAARSSDAEVAANSKAMLGQIRLSQGRFADAVQFFDEALPGLNGRDFRQASQLAEQARRADRGRNMTVGDFRIETTHAVATPDSGFALQVGAFSEHERANRAAEEARQLADRAGIKPVKIVPMTDPRGRRLYLVRLGHFQTRSAAAEARQRLGRLDYIVATWSRTATGG